MSLRTRIALLVGLTVLIASAVGGVGTTLSSRSVALDQVDQALEADAEPFVDSQRVGTQLQFVFTARRAACEADTGLIDGLGTTQAPIDETSTGAPLNNRGNGLRLLPNFASNVQRIRPDGAAVAACQTLPISDQDRAIAEAGEGRAFRTVRVDGEQFRVLTVGYRDIGAVQFARSLDLTGGALRGLLLRSIGFGLLGALIASAVGWLFAKRATEPVQRLSDAAEHVARTKDLGQRIEVHGHDEIATLATSFNTMLSSLDTSRAQQHQLVQDASHELRTPLTSMRTNVELLQRHPGMEPTVRGEILQDIGAELNELTDLASELVESATEVPTTLTLHDHVDLLEAATECVERARRRHRATINITGPSSVVLGDNALLARCVTNLVNNAAKFSGEGAVIDVVLGEGSLTVQDMGPGIPDDDLPHIFERFYRATEARSAPGSGLGLSIVLQIIEGHGGTVHAANRRDGGAAIGFTVPTISTVPEDEAD